MISPAKTAADSRYWRSIKYSLFPPLGLATLAGYLDPDDEVDLQDEHVETLRLDDEPDLVVIEAYITSAGRAYRYADHYRAKGAHVCLGGLHLTSLPDEAARHADTMFLGPGEDTWPAFLPTSAPAAPAAVPLHRADARRHATAAPRPHQAPSLPRPQLPGRLPRLPPPLRLLLQGGVLPRRQVLLHAGRRRRPRRDRAPPGAAPLLPRRQPLRQPAVRRGALRRAQGMGRLWQAAGTVQAVLRPGLLENAAESGLRSLFVGFETLSDANLAAPARRRTGRRGVLIFFFFFLTHRRAALRRRRPPPARPRRDGQRQLRLRHGRGRPLRLRAHGRVGLSQGVETATFHILTPYPGTRLQRRLAAEGRITSRDWDLYDTRHAVFTPAGMTPEELEAGYWGAYREFYRWRNILRASFAHDDAARARAPPRLHQRLEEARANVGLGDPQRPGAPLPAAAGSGPRPLRQRRRGDAGAARAARGERRARPAGDRRDGAASSRLSDGARRYTPNRLCSR